MHSKAIAVILLLLLSYSVQAQPDTLLLKPGNTIIDGTIIKPYTNKWKVTYFDAQGKAVPNKVWTDYGQIIELDDKQYFHRVQDLYDPKMNLLVTWINMVELNTLLPVSFSTLSPSGGFSYYQFDGNHIIGSANNQSKEREIISIDKTLAESVYDWNMYGMLLIGLPLKEHLIAKLPYASTPSGELKWLVAHVTGKDQLSVPNNKTITTWKVETNQNLTFWLSKKAPYVIKLEAYLPNNTKMVWEMI
ncbi:MAG TPA: hypothetical protein PKL31_00145 [Fulvivirga sp.]|nr:hypothetical protein [Fulvivirga sp.]